MTNQMAQPACGRLSWLTAGGRFGVAETLAFDLRLEWVAVVKEDQVHAVLDRARLRAWLTETPGTIFSIDDVGLTFKDGRMLLFIGDQCWYVPADVARPLAENL